MRLRSSRSASLPSRPRARAEMCKSVERTGWWQPGLGQTAFLGRTPLCRISRGLTRMAARSCETLCASTELLLFQTPHQYRRLEKSGIPAKSLPGGKASKIFPACWWTQRMGRCDGSGSPSTVCSRSTGPTSRVSQSHVGRCL